MVKLGLALGAALLSGATLAAPESLVKVNTDKGEVLLEVLATGTSTAKIVKISTYCELRVNGSNKDEAAKLLAKQEQAFLNGMQAAGLGTVALDFSTPATLKTDGYYEVSVAATSAAVAAANVAAYASEATTEATESSAEKVSTVGLSRRVGVSSASVIDMQEARSVFNEFGCDEDYQMIRRPNIQLADESGAKAKATTAAVATAKAQAENYAAALNMRVVRMLRVSETGAIREFLGPESDFIMQEMRNERDRRGPVSNDVPITASISVDFVLGPKN